MYIPPPKTAPPKMRNMMLLASFIVGAVLMTSASKWAGLEGGIMRPLILLAPPALLGSVFAFQALRKYIKERKPETIQDTGETQATDQQG